MRCLFCHLAHVDNGGVFVVFGVSLCRMHAEVMVGRIAAGESVRKIIESYSQ